MSTLRSLGTQDFSILCKRSSPPRRGCQSSQTDVFQPSSGAGLNLIQPDPSLARPKQKSAGFTFGKAALGGVALLGVAMGLTGCKPEPPRPVTQTRSVPETRTEAAREAAAVDLKAEFAEGRTLLVDRSDRVHARQFDPNPANALERRGGRFLFEESYIADLIDRDLTQVPDGAPRFTAVGVDENQSSKLYFNSDLEPVSFGKGSLESEPFYTRPTRMNGRGAGIHDTISQYQLSCIYRLENSATLDGVELEPGLYRLTVMEPNSRVATTAMQRGVCPGHRLVPSGSGISGDYTPTQLSPDGQQLNLNPEDIVQVWSLTAEEAARYQ